VLGVEAMQRALGEWRWGLGCELWDLERNEILVRFNVLDMVLGYTREDTLNEMQEVQGLCGTGESKIRCYA
jgi:hypothetical protein